MSIERSDVPNHSAWRHWGCVTPKIIENVKKSFEDADGLDGFEDLKEEDQEKLKAAWEAGHVADEDIPPSARKEAAGDEEEEDKPKKRASKKKKEVNEDEEEEEKPKKPRGRKPKVRYIHYLPPRRSPTGFRRPPSLVLRNPLKNPRPPVLVSPRYEQCDCFATDKLTRLYRKLFRTSRMQRKRRLKQRRSLKRSQLLARSPNPKRRSPRLSRSRRQRLHQRRKLKLSPRPGPRQRRRPLRRFV